MILDVAKELKNSLLWGYVIEEIDRMIYFEEKNLRTCKPEELTAFQYKIAALESVKRIPQDVIDRDEGEVELQT